MQRCVGKLATSRKSPSRALRLNSADRIANAAGLSGERVDYRKTNAHRRRVRIAATAHHAVVACTILSMAGQSRRGLIAIAGNRAIDQGGFKMRNEA